jgi:hypothetical protein
METIQADDRLCGKAQLGDPGDRDALPHRLADDVEGTPIPRGRGFA